MFIQNRALKRPRITNYHLQVAVNPKSGVKLPRDAFGKLFPSTHIEAETNKRKNKQAKRKARKVHKITKQMTIKID